MKKEELMIGDWVTVSGKPMQVASIGTTRVGFKDEGGYIFYHLYEEVNPIPLSEEIAEKNGFVGTPTKDLFIEMNLREIYSLELLPSEGSWILRFTYKTNKYICGCSRICNLYIKYVHELQHALRLCGINKEIIIK